MYLTTFFKRREFFKTTFVFFYAFLSLICLFGGALKAQPFDKTKDILISQFDNKPDCDDLHAQAALGSILLHADGQGINYYAVMGTYGKQSGPYFNSSTLFTMAFGAQNTNWTNADSDRSNSVIRIRNKVKPILLAGGKAWVQEAGQSDVTLLWINALIADGVPAATVKNNVMVVQHSLWNEGQASAGVLNDVKLKATYIPIDDGNEPWGTGTDRGPNTPDYKLAETIYMNEALSASNPNSSAKALWTEAKRIEDALPTGTGYIKHGLNVDFSDCVEAWYILGLGSNSDNVRKFWDRYVVNTTTIVPATGVTMSGCPTSSKNVGSTVQLTAMVLPTNATNKAVSWTSSNTAVATVSTSGLVTAVAEGTATITVTTLDGGFKATCNITVIASVPFDAFSQIEAENYSSMFGVQNQTCTEGGQNVAYINNGDYIVFNNVNFGTGAVSLEARVACGATGGSIEVRLGSITGTLLGTCAITNTGGWQTWTTMTCAISGASGTQNLFLKFTGGTGFLFNVNWFKFIAGSGGKLSQFITFGTLAPKTVGDADFNPGATASSGLTVTYESDNTNVATIVGGNIHIVGEGTANITASQIGDATYDAATPVVQTLTVNTNQTLPDVTALTAWVSGTNNPTVSGSNRMMVVMVMGESTVAFMANSATYGGQAMTRVADKAITSGSTTYSAIFILKEVGVNVATSGTINVVWSATPAGSSIYSVLLANVDQTTTIAKALNGLAAATTIATTTALAAENGDMVVMCGATANNNIASVNNGFTEKNESNSTWGDGVTGMKMGTGVNETPSFTQSASGRMTICAIVAKKATTLKSASIGADNANENENSIRIYPNPVSRILNIGFNNSEMSREIKVFNLMGQMVYSSKTQSNNTQINVQSLNLKGMILVQVTTGNSVSNHRVLIQK